MLSLILAAAGDPATVIPYIGGGGLSAVLFYLLMDGTKERRTLQSSHDEMVNKMLPTLTAVATLMERVLEALSKQVEYHDRRPDDPEILRRAYDQLERLLDEYPPPTTERRRGRGT